jgi:hypothetical protein
MYLCCSCTCTYVAHVHVLMLLMYTYLCCSCTRTYVVHVHVLMLLMYTYLCCSCTCTYACFKVTLPITLCVRQNIALCLNCMSIICTALDFSQVVIRPSFIREHLRLCIFSHQDLIELWVSSSIHCQALDQQTTLIFSLVHAEYSPLMFHHFLGGTFLFQHEIL